MRALVDLKFLALSDDLKFGILNDNGGEIYLSVLIKTKLLVNKTYIVPYDQQINNLF